MFRKSVLRNIRKTIGRFMAILSIIALGVGFFSGLRVTETAMLKTADEYLRDLSLYDFRLISTLGFTEEDVEAFSELDGVETACGAVSADLIYVSDSGSDAVLHAHSLTEGINGIDILYGRMPQSPDECVLDAKISGESAVGSTIRLSEDNPEDSSELFAFREYRVVGVANASYYMNYERGSTALGSGAVAGFVYMLPEGFQCEYFTEIFLSIPYCGEMYSDEYVSAVDELRGEVEALLDERGRIRYMDIYKEAEDKLDDARRELDEGRETYLSERADAEKELSDGKKMLDEAAAELEKARLELAEGRVELDNSRLDTERRLADAAKELDRARVSLDESKEQLESLTELYVAGEELARGLSAGMGMSLEEPSELMAMLASGENPVLNAAADGALASSGTTGAELSAAWLAAQSSLGAPLTAETLRTMQSSLDRARIQYDEAAAELSENTREAEKKLAEGEQELADGAEKLAEGEAEYAEKLSEYEQAKADAEREFADAEQELKDGEQEIADGEAELVRLKRPSLYTLDRTSNVGYACFENDTAIVSGVAKVFPMFFFLVAALVCITTMTRMVGEQRTENGVLKALGYGNGAIAAQYLFYAGSASAVGCGLGFLLGSKFLPLALWQVYNILYSIQRPLRFVLDFGLFSFCSALYLVCALGATWLVCRRDLMESTAQLIRPKAPAAGKRILLERVGFIWKRIKFLNKVSIRNIVRYKKRMIMMILGIGGCTALLITGFGIRDTIQPVVGYQFDEITLYDAIVSFAEPVDLAEREEFADAASEVVQSIAFLHSETADVVAEEGGGSVNMIVYEQTPEEFVDLHRGKTPVAWPERGEAVVNYRFANECGIEVGDRIELVDGEYNSLTVTVSGIFDNYIYDYVYLSAETYEEQTGRAPDVGTAYVSFAEGMDVHAAGAELLGMENIGAVTVSEELISRMDSMLKSLDYIVLIVLVCAGALAFIVLYNLTNITIIERTREIATLKVLGFYINEQNSYVFRENLVLTGISAFFGIPMGLALLYYVMSQIKLDGIYFGCKLNPLSCLWAILLTFVFTLVVDAALMAKTGRINMAEAMKAVE